MKDKIKEDMNIVIVGHVDHGKSTIIGRMLADTNSLPEGKLEQVKETCRRNSKPFEYAFLLDALKDEQAQGITIDSARCFFHTEKRNYIIIDAPGHIEFLKNMITGASRAEAALLVIDAKEGVRENSKRHGYMLSMLGVKQITVVVNKMDLVDYDEGIFRKIVGEYNEFLKKIGVNARKYIPVSAFNGDNIASISDKMQWYKGDTVLDTLDDFAKQKAPENLPFRMGVQDIYKFTRNGDNRRIVAGNVTCGKIHKGDTVVFYPSGKRSKVKSLEIFNAPTPECFSPGEPAGFTLDEQIYIKRGELAALESEEAPKVTSRFKANLFWLGKKPMEKNKKYFLKLATAKIPLEIESIIRVLDASELTESNKDKIEQLDIAECIFTTDMPFAFDLIDKVQETSRFVVVDDYEIRGGGIITEALSDTQSAVREQVFKRESKWVQSDIDKLSKAERYNQKPTLILITGNKDSGKKPFAKSLEKKLFIEGKFVYYLGIANVLYGIDADIKADDNPEIRHEHLRRLGEIANILLDTGLIVIVTAIELTKDELEMIQTSIEFEHIETVWIGNKKTTDIPVGLHISTDDDKISAMDKLKGRLQDAGIIYKP